MGSFPVKRQANTCVPDTGRQFYNCQNTSFIGCCSKDACSQNNADFCQKEVNQLGSGLIGDNGSASASTIGQDGNRSTTIDTRVGLATITIITASHASPSQTFLIPTRSSSATPNSILAPAPTNSPAYFSSTEGSNSSKNKVDPKTIAVPVAIGSLILLGVCGFLLLRCYRKKNAKGAKIRPVDSGDREGRPPSYSTKGRNTSFFSNIFDALRLNGRNSNSSSGKHGSSYTSTNRLAPGQVHVYAHGRHRHCPVGVTGPVNSQLYSDRSASITGTYGATTSDISSPDYSSHYQSNSPSISPPTTNPSPFAAGRRNARHYSLSAQQTPATTFPTPVHLYTSDFQGQYRGSMHPHGYYTPAARSSAVLHELPGSYGPSLHPQKRLSEMGPGTND